jgi:hypothetical protein
MADSEMLAAAKAEVERLEAELQATTAYQKLQLAKQVVALYDRIPSARFSIGGKPAAPSQVVSHITQDRALTTKTARIEATAANYLKEKGARAPASELLGPMHKAGIAIGGAEPVKALSAYLSSSKALNNVREFGGYGLAEWGNNRGPDLLTETGA